MPRFSVVVPVYRVRAYLRECLDSVLGQSFDDLEVVAVDDCSPDGSGAILDEYAGRDPRVRALHLPANSGLGPARNAGMRSATGDYLLFLDSDDTFAAGSLEEIAMRLKETGDPDVLLFDYARRYWDGTLKRSAGAADFAHTGPVVFRAAERPEFLRHLWVAWDRAYRREFVQAHSFGFPRGYYEDVPWTFPILLTADRIAALDRVCVHYRQRRHGSILSSRSREHFAVIDQWARVFAFLDANGELQEWRPFLFTRMLDHLIGVLEAPGRLSPADRPEFVRRAAQAYRRFRPPGGFAAPNRSRAVQYDLLRREAVPALAAVRRGRQARRWAGAHIGPLARRTSDAVRKADTARQLAFYRAQLGHALDPHLAVYASYWYRGYSGNPRAVYEKARELAPQLRGVWVALPGRESAFPPGVDVVTDRSPDYYRAIARATYLVNDVNFPDYVVKRRGSVHLQTQHGTPLKRMGLDLLSRPAAAAGMDFRELLRRADRWDFNLSANRYSTEVWERAFPSRFESLEYGYPRNDRYFAATAGDIADIRRDLGIPARRRVVLYAPTHRDYEPLVRMRLDAEALSDGLDDDVVLLVRAHYFHDEFPRLRRLEQTGRLLDVSGHPCIEDLCLASDVLVTDYSSVMFDFANLDRPIVILADDWETYVAVRGVYFDLLASPPGPVVRTTADLLDVLLSGADDDPTARALRNAFRARFCEYDDGLAAERVVRRVFLGEEPAPPLPWSERPVAPRPPGVAR